MVSIVVYSNALVILVSNIQIELLFRIFFIKNRKKENQNLF
jgi:hypothetical protein